MSGLFPAQPLYTFSGKSKLYSTAENRALGEGYTPPRWTSALKYGGGNLVFNWLCC